MARKPTRPESAMKQLTEAIQDLGRTQGLNTVFTTFLEITTLCLSAETDPIHAKERHERYLQIVKDMAPDVVTAYARMTALIYLAVKENEDDPCDILGAIYHHLRLNNEWNGQFFTPDEISRMMALLINPACEASLEEKGFVAINEPTCGSGTMVIGAVWAMMQNHIDYQKKSLFVAQDIDIRCVWMTYIQLTLYRIPAVVIHGNTLTMEEWSHWITPYAHVPLMEAEKAKEDVAV